MYKNATTMKQLLELGAKRAYIRWDLKKGYIQLEGNATNAAIAAESRILDARFSLRSPGRPRPDGI